MSKKRSSKTNKDWRQVLDINLKFEFTDKQKEIIDVLTNGCQMSLIDGVAGTGKSLIAIYSALTLYFQNRIDRILYVRTPVETGKSIGFLPGTASEKLSSYMDPLFEKLEELLGGKKVEELTGTGLSTKPPIIECAPINFMRGRNLSRTFVVLDEAQNCTKQELVTLISRIAEDSKICLLGDSMQTDIRNSGWKEVFELFNDEQSQDEGIYCFYFDFNDIKRSRIVKYILGKIHAQNQFNVRNAIQERDGEKLNELSQGSFNWSPSRREVVCKQ